MQRLDKNLTGAFRIVVDADRLQGVLDTLDISHRELARRTRGDVTHATVTNMARGHHSPTMRTVDAVTRVVMRDVKRQYDLNQQEVLELLGVDETEKPRDRRE